MKSKKGCLSKRSILLTTSLLALVFAITGQVSAGEIDHFYKSHDALVKEYRSNSVWEEITEYEIPSTTFTAGKKYLIVINFSINTGGSAADNGMARVLHGSTKPYTVFPDSTYRNETRRTGDTNCGHGYNYWTVWTAVAGQGIHVEMTQPSTSAIYVKTVEYEAFVMNLSDDLTENTDWFYEHIDTHAGNLPTSWGVAPGIGASITFDGGNNDWLILGLGRFLSDDITYRYLMRIYDVTAATGYSQIKIVQEDVDDYRPHMIMTGLATVGANHTVRVEARNQIALTHDWTDSKIFALNLNKFMDHWIGYSTTTPVTLSSLGAWYEVYGKPDYAASQAGNILIWSQEIADVGSHKNVVQSQMTLDGSVVPTGHSDARRELPHGNNDEDPHHRIYRGSVSAGSHDIDIDMAEMTYVTLPPVIDIDGLVIFSMEKAAANIPPTLNWTGDTGYTTDGVEPDSATSGSTFEFRVEYSDQDNDAPTIKEVWVDLDDSGTYAAGEKFDMTSLGGSDYTAGVDYSKSMSISRAGDGILNYRFYFTDAEDAATGAPASDDNFTVLSNNAPTLNWTGDTGYTVDGVDPDSGDSGSTFEFRVEYTDQDNDAPTIKEVWVDLDDSGTYAPGEKFDMTSLGGSDYTAGVDYSKSVSVYHAGDGTLNYRFYFKDGEDSATGAPTNDYSLTVNPNNIPTLNWTGDTGYTVDGVEPNSATSGSTFEFRVEYTDQDNDAPGVKQVWVDLDDSGTYAAGEKFDMTSLGGSDYTAGVDYSKSMSIIRAGDGILKYTFYFKDGEDPATGDPANDNPFTVTNNIPTLNWTYFAGFNGDGVNPNTGVYGSSFEFQVEYTDGDNAPPTVKQVWIDLDDSGTYEPGEKFDMTEVNAGDTDYTDGKDYTYSTNMVHPGGGSDGVLNYRFYFTDGQDAATGAPTGNDTFTILPNSVPTLNWTYNAGFDGDGVNPNTGVYGSTFEFQVEYTDGDNHPPAVKQVWIDLDDSGTYEPGEKFDMTEVAPGDTDYTDGKDYTYSASIVHPGGGSDGILNYKFDFTDGTDAATGDPASDYTFTVNPNTPPALGWTGDTGYTTDGVGPNTGNYGSTFEFRVKYTDSDNHAPTIKEVWVDLDDSGTYAAGEKFDMTSQGGTDYTAGVDYSKSMSIIRAGDGTLNYRFYFTDGVDPATGAPTSDRSFIVLPNNAPTLYWTGDTGYTTDGVNPDTASSGSTFEFRVEYTDSDNHAPTIKEVWVDLDDSGTYESSEKFEMTLLSGSNYVLGVDYTKSITIDHGGGGSVILNYRFYFTDGVDPAIGAPTSDRTFTVSAAPGTIHYVDGDTGDDALNAPYTSTLAPAKNIQVAINACVSGTVYVKKKTTGTYGKINMTSNVNVVGTTDAWYGPSSRDDYPTVNKTDRATVRFLGPLSNCRLSYFKVTGGKMEEGQIYVSGKNGEIGNDVIIEKCWLYQGSHVGIQLKGPVAPTIRDCDIEDPRTSGISSFLYGIDPASTPMIIQGCNLSGLAGYGDGWGLRAGISLVAENDGNFDVVIGGDGALANHIHDMGRAGIRLEDLGAGCDITIDNNEIDNNSDGQYYLYAPGILVDNVSKVTITRNTIHDNMRAGIAIANDSDVTIGAESSVTGAIADIQSQYGNDIYGNYAGVSFGGKSKASSNGNFVIRGNQIYSNRMSTKGAGIALRGEVTGTLLIKQNEIYDNYWGGISIQDNCTAEIIQNNIYNQFKRGGIHTGYGNTFYGTNGGADLTIRQNKVHDNLNVNRGGGIDVRHASGIIENNIVYNNSRGGIRFSDWIDEIVHNTVVNNGNATKDSGGGIIYDDLTGGVMDPPDSVPPAPLLILNNISAYNHKAGIRACFDNTEGSEERDYNLLYANYPWNSAFNRPNSEDCGWPDLDDMSCIRQQYGGCVAYFVKGVGIVLDDPNDIIANPYFKDMAGNDYRLQRLGEGDDNDSPAINAGDDGTDMGAYGGTYYIDDSEIP